ncbi:hypothetical protein TWF730_006057 [Orbilia blumenaviensis]|uniref:Peptidase S8/S53 domain-containing protein n=1 Tax=Orbilia blumenaviensis TaxID=1796055 RepID=A0AAV9VK75_9PEZI
MRRNKQNVFSVGLAVLVVIPCLLFSKTDAFPASSDIDMESVRSIDSGVLGWDKRIEDKYRLDEMLTFTVILKEAYWKDGTVINNIKRMFERIQDLDVDMDDGRLRKRIYSPSYKGVGTPFIMVRGQYYKIANVILGEPSDAEPHQIVGALQYLECWGIIEGERSFHSKMLWADENQFPDSQEGSKESSSFGSPLLRRGEDLHRWHRTQSSSASIGAIYPIRQNLTKRSPKKYEVQDQLLEDMRYYSKPPSISTDEWKSHVVYYEDSEGSGVDVFVLDSGLASHASEHSEFRHAYDNDQIKGWIYSEGPEQLTGFRDFADPNQGVDFHGTYVISKIIGSSTGYARKANIWVGVVTDSTDWCSPWYLIDVLFETLRRIDDNTSENPGYKAIINISTVIDYHRVGDEGRPIQEWPAKRGSSMENLVVVGSADHSGKINAWAKADFVEIYGRTDDIFVPKFEIQGNSQEGALAADGKNIYTAEDGISFGKSLRVVTRSSRCSCGREASKCLLNKPVIPIICGILATHFSANPSWSPKQAIEKLYTDAYIRGEGPDAVKIAWTGITPPSDSCSSGGDGSSRKQITSLNRHYSIHRRSDCRDISNVEEKAGVDPKLDLDPYAVVVHQTIFRTVEVTITKTKLATKVTKITRTVAIPSIIAGLS